MDIVQIISALKIADYQSFSKAADALFISQSALSLRIRKLEDELGFRLYDRSHQTFSLTPEGELFYTYALPVVDSWEKLNNKISAINHTAEKKFTIGVVLTARNRGAFDPIMDFITSNSSLNINMVHNTSNEIIKKLVNEEVDVAVIPLIDKLEYPISPSLDYYYLFSEESGLLVSKNSELSNLESITLDEVSKLPFIAYRNDNLYESDEDHMYNSFHIRPSIVYSTNDINDCYESVAKGVGVKIDPLSLASSHNMVGIHLDPPVIDSHTHLMHLSRKANDPNIKSFRDYILKNYNLPNDEPVNHAPHLG